MSRLPPDPDDAERWVTAQLDAMVAGGPQRRWRANVLGDKAAAVATAADMYNVVSVRMNRDEYLLVNAARHKAGVPKGAFVRLAMAEYAIRHFGVAPEDIPATLAGLVRLPK
jgi:hypothetical protein